jgi:hypothetical protein
MVGLLKPLVWLGVTCALATPLRAALILDDFNDPAELRLPEMRFDDVQTTGVGALSATRTLDVGTSAPAVGVFAADSLLNSALAAQLGTVNPRTIARSIDLHVFYRFPFFDATEGGVNDGILLDFRSFRRGNVFAGLDVYARDDVTGRHMTSAQLPDRTEPFTLAIPFSAFTRGEQVLHADQLQGLSFSVGLTAPADVSELGFSMVIDRIRIGRVPEPATSGMGGIAAGTLLVGGRRRRRWV